MAFDGSCHCGAVTFTVEVDPPSEAMSCNCSHCRRKGFLWTFQPADTFTLTAGADALTDYQFYQHKIHHRFCATCGCQTHGDGEAPDGRQIAAVNLRCVPGIDLETLAVKQVDGASF